MGRREKSDRLVINVKAVMHVSRETNERMGRNFLEKEMRTHTSTISAIYIFNCLHFLIRIKLLFASET